MPPNASEPTAPSRLMSQFWLLTGIGALVVICALLFVPAFAPWLLRFEYWTADWRTALLSDQARDQHPKVAIVTITDATLKDYVSSPMDRGLLARVIKAVDAAGARAIGLDVYYLKKTDAEKDQALVEALKSAKARVVVGALDERRAGDLETFQREFQTQFLDSIGRPVGYLNLRTERDEIVRYTAPPGVGSKYPRSFAGLLAEAGGAPPTNDDSRPIAWLRPLEDGRPAFTMLPAHDLLADPDLGIRLKDKVVLIGADRPRIDRHRLPLSVRDGGDVPGVLIHAQVIAMLMEPARAVHELDFTSVRMLLLAIAILGCGLGWRLGRSNIVGWFGGGFATVVLVAIDAFLFREVRLLLPFTLAAVSWVAGLTAGRAMRSCIAGPLLERRTAT